MHHDPERSTGCLSHQGEPDCTTKELNLSASTGNMTLQYTIVMMVETIVSHVVVCENGTKNAIYIDFIYNININVRT